MATPCNQVETIKKLEISSAEMNVVMMSMSSDLQEIKVLLKSVQEFIAEYNGGKKVLLWLAAFIIAAVGSVCSYLRYKGE